MIQIVYLEEKEKNSYHETEREYIASTKSKKKIFFQRKNLFNFKIGASTRLYDMTVE